MSNESDPVYGPRRRAPHYYVGEHYGNEPIGGTVPGGVRHTKPRQIQYPDVERHPNGAIPGVRNKIARRIIRGALKRRFSRVERALKLPRAMMAQAREVARDEKKSPAWARNLYLKELSIHQTVYAPDQKALRAMRTEKRRRERRGEVDAIEALVDRMSKKP